MPNQHWRSLETVRRLNDLTRAGFAVEFLRHNAACRPDYARTRRQCTRDTTHANAAWARRRGNTPRDIPGLLFVLPAVCCCALANQRSLSSRNSLTGRPEDYATRCSPRCVAVAGKRMMTKLFGRQRALLVAAGAAWAACGALDTAGAAPLSAAEFEALAARCAPSVPAATLEAVAKTESALDPWVLHDNTTNHTAVPVSLPAALGRAKRWIDRGDSVDLGLMQIDSANLARLGLSIANALDACSSIQAGAHILQEDYRVALRDTLSRYNTGDPARGIINGYVARVEARVADIAASRLLPSAEPSPPPPVQGWNVFAPTNGERFVSTDSNSGVH